MQKAGKYFLYLCGVSAVVLLTGIFLDQPSLYKPAALITAISQAESEGKPLLLQFWQPHWMHSKIKMAEVKLPDVTPECAASAAAKDGKYACDYPVDDLYKAASAKLEAKNAAAFAFLKKFQLTTEQQNEIAAMVDFGKMEASAAAAQWVDANPDIVKGWLG